MKMLIRHYLVKFVVRLARNINVKVNNKSTVKFFNKLKIKEAYEIVKIINHILLKSLGEIYC